MLEADSLSAALEQIAPLTGPLARLDDSDSPYGGVYAPSGSPGATTYSTTTGSPIRYASCWRRSPCWRWTSTGCPRIK